MFRLSIVAALLASLTAAAQAADAPAEIKLGTLYASAGRYASISLPVHYGLKLWIDQKNAEGGVYVKAFNKKIPLKLVAYDDQSNTATAATLYNQLITQDKVDILISDSGSVLTSVAVPIARDHKMLLIDQTGTGATFFTPDNPYIALMADPVSSIWPKPLADFLTQMVPASASNASPSSTPPTTSPARKPTRCASSSRNPIPAWKSSTTRAYRPRPRITRYCSTISARPIPTRWSISATRRTTSRSCATSRTAASSSSFCSASIRGPRTSSLRRALATGRLITCSPT